MRDVPVLQASGAIETFMHREVLPYAACAWFEAESVEVGYEISFTRYSCIPKPIRTLAENSSGYRCIGERDGRAFESILIDIRT